jgi:putative FmdB family regulatory protein
LPRYDYLCPNCKNEFEIRQSFSSEPVAPCPKCQSTARRVIHSVPIVFKGSGFYVNDYGKGKGSTSESKASKESSESDDSKASSKSESKSESESESKVESKSSPGKDESS